MLTDCCLPWRAATVLGRKLPAASAVPTRGADTGPTRRKSRRLRFLAMRVPFPGRHQIKITREPVRPRDGLLVLRGVRRKGPGPILTLAESARSKQLPKAPVVFTYPGAEPGSGTQSRPDRHVTEAPSWAHSCPFLSFFSSQRSSSRRTMLAEAGDATPTGRRRPVGHRRTRSTITLQGSAVRCRECRR